MTTPLAGEPLPGDGQVPYMSTLVHRLYHRLPEVYRVMDERDSTWALKRYLGAALNQAGAVYDAIVDAAGSDPVGPATPEPVNLPDDELATWRANRVKRLSRLGDPDNADPAWLPWLAQMIGVTLDPAATLPEKRDTIRFATSGYRAGTRAAIAEAAKSALTGSRFARVVPHMKPDAAEGLIAGSTWDITIVTRGSETPDPGAVLAAVLRKGVKPAGAVLWTRTFEASWSAIEAQYPTWADWENATWQQIEEAGLTYADVPDNLAPNPSFNTNATGWSGVNSTISRVSGGVDGAWAGRITSTSAASACGMVSTAAVTGLNDQRSYVFACSLKTHVALTGVTLKIEWRDASNAVLSTTSVAGPTIAPADGWTRVSSSHLAPVGATSAYVTVSLGTVAVGEYCDVDAILLRLT